MRWFLGFLVMLTASPALAFEGEIDAKSIGDTSHQAEFTIHVSNAGDVRMDTSAKDRRGKSQRVSYIKPAKGKYDYMVDHGQKQGMKIPKDALSKFPQDQGANDKRKPPKLEITKLGTAAVAGQTTRRVRITDKDSGDTADLWLSDGYPQDLWLKVFTVGGIEGQSPTRQWTQVAASYRGFKPGFIMKMVSTGKRGVESGLEVTRMEEKKVTTDKFAIPPGYEVATMPDMPSGTPTMKRPTTKEEAEKMRDEWMKKTQEEQH